MIALLCIIWKIMTDSNPCPIIFPILYNRRQIMLNKHTDKGILARKKKTCIFLGAAAKIDLLKNASATTQVSQKNL